MKAIRLRTEYLENPVGIAFASPRLCWNCEGGVTQTAYQIVATSGENTLWDSGKVTSSQMAGIPWGGARLHSRDEIHWQVRLWDETDTPGEWCEGSFEIGLFEASDWTGKWITGNYKPKKKVRYPVDCFKHHFSAQKTVKARLYATACGLYEGRLNGQRIGGYVLAPGITNYKKRIQYQTYDVTALLKAGENELTFELADGWYRGSTGAWGLTNQYGTETKLLAQLELTDASGQVTVIATDGNWKWSNDGPIRFGDNKDGEIVDARLTPSYADRAKLTRCPVTPTASNNVAVMERETFTPTIIKTPRGQTVLDFGQNLAGYVAFTLQGKNGQNVKLRFGEMLDAQGEFTQKNIQCANKKITTPLQQVIYTCRDGENQYKTKFAIFGFQYVLVESDASFKPEDFTAIAVYSAMEQTAVFESSNPLLNQFVDCTLWSAKGNSADLPTDCPTRERHGWTGDAQIFCNTAGYLFDYAPFARKYIQDIMDWQRKDGCFPQIAPYGGVDFYMNTLNGSVGWSDAGVMMPYRLWKLYGDDQILHIHYNAMRRYAQFMQRRCGKFHILAKPLPVKNAHKRYIPNCGQAYGEWAEPADVMPLVLTDMIFPHPEEGTAYTCYVMELMEEIALALGKESDAAEYRSYADGTRAAYQTLVETPKFSLDTDRQARLVRPLYFGLLDPAQEKFAKRRLIEALDHYGWRLGTGFLSTPLILDVLTDIDISYAYRLLENEEMPGWLFMPKNNATTVWESWEGIMAQGGIASLNHYSKGACCEWLFRVMCGIQVSGENHFIIAPRPGGQFTHAGLTYTSVYGQVSCRWERKDGQTVYTVSVPSNCTAQVILPDGRSEMIPAGKAQYTIQEGA